MLTLFHAPQSRSGSILQLIDEMGVADHVTVREVSVRRQDGSGAIDPANPHPEGKVPYLVAGDDYVRERGAIILYLTDRFQSPLGRGVGHAQRGAYVSWLFWYQGVLEPAFTLDWAGIHHPAAYANWRDLDTALARLDEALDGQDYLLGDEYSAADLLISSPFLWFPDQVQLSARVADWVARCGARPSVVRVS